MRVAAVIVIIVVLLISLALIPILRHGLSARGQPTATEEVVARTVRHFATPESMRGVRNPIPLTNEVLADARAHWADHCATCHANDGSGDTEIGRGLYPKVPDMRQQRTQALSDGELFSVIKNGVRLSGMPAWGDAAGHDDADNWKLVHFIRHLPKITARELDEMKKLNPKSPMEMNEERDEENFLEGSEHK